jgi:hypothetical protein
MIKIILPDYPTKLQMTKGRRKKYFEEGKPFPKKYHGDGFEFKKGRLYDKVEKDFVIKNARFVDEPRYQPLSYNKISTKLKGPVLAKLKEWMSDFIPSSLNIQTPIHVSALVYDLPVPLNKDLDNMHIYFKAFLDLLKDRGLIKDDSKQFVTQAGGFRFKPVNNVAERRMVFFIETEPDESVRSQMMYNLHPKVVSRSRNPQGIPLMESKRPEPGSVLMFDDHLFVNFGKTKVIKDKADKAFRELFNIAVNSNKAIYVSEEFYKLHAVRIERFLLKEGVPVGIKIT